MEKIGKNNINLLKTLKVAIASAMIGFFPPAENDQIKNQEKNTQSEFFNIDGKKQAEVKENEMLASEIAEILFERGNGRSNDKEFSDQAFEYIVFAYAKLEEAVADQIGDQEKLVEKTIDGRTCFFSARAQRAAGLLYALNKDTASSLLDACFKTYFDQKVTDARRIEFDIYQKVENEIAELEIGEEKYIYFEWKAFDKDGNILTTFGIRFYGHPEMDENRFRLEIN